MSSKEEKKEAFSLGPDPHSWANYEQAKTTGINIVCTVDFKRKIFFGHIDHVIQTQTDSFSDPHVNFDMRGISVESVKLVDSKTQDETAATWLIPKTHAVLGSCLTVSLPKDVKKTDKTTVRIYFQTSKASSGIQWMEPDQTHSKKHPFCYSQFEAILARTFVPCQDTPAVKSPYSITVTCPSPLVAACSGNARKTNPIFEDDGSLTWVYDQPNPIPAYLIAVAVGALARGKIGPRSHVWCEKPLLEACVHEFEQDTENYIQAGEKVTGVKYNWDGYDLLVLPAAFPYGGMENPQLTFLSSSLLAGDRSLTNVVAHEIVHSWSGNYVTNSNWFDFWLNEGFTVYIERLVLGEVMKSEAYRHFECLIGYNDLVKTCQEFASENPEFTKLHQKIHEIDPDDAFSKIPYEKGSLFLLYLETQIVGGKSAMMAWLKHYFTKYQWRSLNTDEMKADFIEFFKDKVSKEKMALVDWNHWLHTSGLPCFDPNKVVDRSMVEGCEKMAKVWLDEEGKSANGGELKGYLSKQIMYFLDCLITSEKKMKTTIVQKLDSLYKFSTSKNVEILFRYLMLSLNCGHTEAKAVAADFLSRHGRGLYVKPLFKALVKLDFSFASKVYRANKNFYHDVIKSFCNGLKL
eukprot:TRINITY_DN11685_c0_g1_i1.p1 TRINITY_DN11685_c0_g1~~TRINITY_DN11685_c0_g1_i1.p1  ORF type:complete len:632 (-),score=172.15 TRINITY_DN11685_c0_g1_i1:237-2132(-)